MNNNIFTSPPNSVANFPQLKAAVAGNFDFSGKSYPNLNTVFFQGSAGADTVIGYVADDTLMGNDGNDALSGLGGQDFLTGGGGDDTLIGGTGNDVLHGNEGRDRISLVGGGQDTVLGGAGFDTLLGSGGRLATTLTRSIEFTTVAGDSRIPSFAGTATTGADTATFSGIERFAFVDGQQVFDTGSTAFAVARLYLAAFNRAPDGLGLAFNVGVIDAGLPLAIMTNSFAASTEFQLRYPQSGHSRLRHPDVPEHPGPCA